MSPLEADLDEAICTYCASGPCDSWEHGMPIHALCAEEEAYRRKVEREIMAPEMAMAMDE